MTNDAPKLKEHQKRATGEFVSTLEALSAANVFDQTVQVSPGIHER